MAHRPQAVQNPLDPAEINERVETWTASQAADLLSTISISSPLTPSPRPARGTTVTIDIPLDASVHEAEPPRPRPEAVHTVYKRREPIRRDSLKRREALLKGKEGSRRRQRWENDRLLSNPYAEPPLPSDWEVRPTHRVHQVPYFLAPLWDAEYARAAEHRALKKKKTGGNKEEAAAAKVTQDLRAKLKRARGAKGLLQDLEVEVRTFVEQWEEKQRQLETEGLIDADSSEDDEIVFVGRNGVMSDEQRAERQRDSLLRKDKLIFQSLVDDHGASFGRYLVHSIATYYGLKTWSVTTGDPARREAYVGLKDGAEASRPNLPRPLWLEV